MENFRLNREIAQLVVLQRIELIGPVLKNLRKLFGRYIFSNFISKYLISVPKISKSYFLLMQSEYSIIEKYLDNNQNILSIGSGIGGLELLICKKLNNHISFIERNYVSKKVRYGWDDANKEAYNSLYLSKKFLLDNNLNKNNFNLYDYDKDIFPRKRFDLIISLYSLDYHYNFEIYEDYFKEIFHENTVLIFDTIRSDYFKNIFKYVDIIKEETDTVHKSKRIACHHLL